MVTKTKVCTKCGEEFPATIEFFYKEKFGKFGLRSNCIKCHSLYNKKYSQTEKGREVYRRSNRKYSKTEKGKKVHKKAHEKYCKSNKGKVARKIINKKAVDKYRRSKKGMLVRKHYSQTKAGKLSRKKATINYYRNNRLSKRVSFMMHRGLRKNKNNKHWEILIPYTVEELALHLQGTIGLTTCFVLLDFWQGFYGSYYHLDHIRPISSFDKKQLHDFNSVAFQECWALDNLQLLSPIENLKKGANYGSL